MDCRQRRGLIERLPWNVIGLRERDSDCDWDHGHELYEHGPDERHCLLLQGRRRQCRRHIRSVERGDGDTRWRAIDANRAGCYTRQCPGWPDVERLDGRYRLQYLSQHEQWRHVHKGQLKRYWVAIVYEYRLNERNEVLLQSNRCKYEW